MFQRLFSKHRSESLRIQNAAEPSTKCYCFVCVELFQHEPSILQEEVESLSNKIAEVHASPVPIWKYLTQSSCNIIAAFAFGRRFRDEDPGRTLLDKHILQLTEALATEFLLEFFPDWLKRLYVLTPLAKKAVAVHVAGIYKFARYVAGVLCRAYLIGR